ncbi:hypothetical protein FE257_000957 [Aspergillus nanangensis]|uniref:Glyoxalase-like domain-containing protein n=1 Tax=Aspergillus nanangensis TaxID=2582783 RepID=A0AAD4GPY6_ASPNN|nr:hypothetical protein FE257_000957 [Aspergillus nanangensis]
MTQPQPNLTRLRQVALLAKDLQSAEELLTKVLGTEVIFRDAQVGTWGLENFLVPLGGDIIEVVSPFREGTTAGRLLQKRGDGGYMIIMQTVDAPARRKYIESSGLSKVIFSHSHGDSHCIQYHPKGIPGGMMPELDSHDPSVRNPDPVGARFSPWHACGPDFGAYAAAMERHSHLHLLQATCRLAPGKEDIEQAARVWENTFGTRREGSDLVFTNSRLKFKRGVDQLPEGLESLTIGIQGKRRYEEVYRRAREINVIKDGRVVMLGVEWHFVELPENEARSRI